MLKYIALLRGINVGGHNRILMNDLKVLFKELQFSHIQTYIQSGNIIFSCANRNKNELEKLISNKINQQYGYRITVFILTKKELEELVFKNPFIKESVIDIKKLYVFFTKPDTAIKDKLQEISLGNDQYHIIKNIIYVKYDIGASKTKLTNRIIEKKLNIITTARNWRTTTKLYEKVCEDQLFFFIATHS